MPRSLGRFLNRSFRSSGGETWSSATAASRAASRLELEAGGTVLIDERTAVTTILVSSVKFLRERRELATRFAAAHRELTDWIKQNPDEAQRMIRAELSAMMRAELSAGLVARAWSRMQITSDASLAEFESWIKDAQKVGFIRNPPDMSRFVELLRP